MKKLLKLALIVGGITAVAKLVTARKAEWHGLTEAQVRDKLDTRLPGRMPDEKRADVTNKVISKMRERGVLLEQDEADAPEPSEVTATSGDTAATVDDERGDNSETV